MVMPYLRMSHPTPPPSVRPPMAVRETMPAGTASPNRWVSRSKSPRRAPPCHSHRAAGRIDVDALIAISRRGVHSKGRLAAALMIDPQRLGRAEPLLYFTGSIRCS
jgi:hypothetical protein